MDLLLTNHHLAELGGTETATVALARGLRRAGHGVAIATARPGAISDLLRDEKFKVVDDLPTLAGLTFDAAIANHNAMALVVRHFLPRVPIVFVSHGPAPGLEAPPSIDISCGRFVAVSEEVRDRWARDGRWDASSVDVIRNAVDVERFAPASPIGARLKRVLVIDNHMPRELQMTVARAVRKIGARARFLGSSGIRTWHTERAINQADCVISLGRGIVEAMACGRAAFVFGRHGCDGYVTAGTHQELRTTNFSGRRYARTMDSDSLADALRSYDVTMGEANRRLACEHHSIDIAVPSYMDSVARARRAPVARTCAIPAEELMWYQREVSRRDRSLSRLMRHPVVRVLRRMRDATIRALSR